MYKHRINARIDDNQKEIVDQLESIQGVTVAKGHDDLLIGYKKMNYWIELKNPNKVSKKTGGVQESAIKKGQKQLREKWQGNYHIVWSLDQILEIIGVTE